MPAKRRFGWEVIHRFYARPQRPVVPRTLPRGDAGVSGKSHRRRASGPGRKSTIALAEAGSVWTTETIGLFVAFAVVGTVAVVTVDRLAGGIETSRSGSA